VKHSQNVRGRTRNIRSVIESSGELGRPLWKQKKIFEMNNKFAEALRKAIEAGQERCTVGVSTAAGTKFPVYYLPGDWG
jgi:hypothetical protein